MKTVQLKRGNTAAVDAYTPAEGEVVVNTTEDDLRVGDGSTVGGHRIPNEDRVVDLIGSNAPGTDLSVSRNTTSVTVESSTGDNATLPAATTSQAGVMTSANLSKLNGIESGAEANQTNAEIKTQYEANANTNAFTDAEKTKLAGLESEKFVGTYVSSAALIADNPSPQDGSYGYVDAGVGSPTDLWVWDDSDNSWQDHGQTSAETPSTIKSKYESNPDTNAFTDAEQSKLGGIEAGAEVNQTNAEIKTQYEANSNTNAFTDSEKTAVGTISSKANTADVLTKTNTTVYTPTADYHPATLKSVQDTVGETSPNVIDYGVLS